MTQLLEKIAVIYMGGTFGCIGEPLSPMPANDFLTMLKNHYPQPYLNFFAAPSIKDSTELTAFDWLNLAEMIGLLATEQAYQRFIIIHGTDTLAYASAFLQHLFGQQYHIIFTGSQYPILDILGQDLRSQSDAQANFNFAIEQISNMCKGVALAFNQQLFAGATCYKAHTHDNNAFMGQPFVDETESNHLNCIDKFDFSTHGIQQVQQKLDQLRIENIYVLPHGKAQFAKQLEHTMIQPPQVLFIQAFGSGNLPYSEDIQSHLQQLQQKGCQVIVSSQVLYGELSQHYATGHWLKDLGVLFDHHISQADSFARVTLLNLIYAEDWHQYW
ncbi:asparaginase domain-containing protein [Acinetobacter sp. c1-l78]|uniref:asparaginase domain-containing protein n=1 Tax=Acinetobacter sp. c1-l78 TaxID=3342803 RepID=UPI0035BA4CF9